MDFPLFSDSLRRLVEYRFSRSSGPGGQKVNKTSSRVTVSVQPELLEGISDEERRLMGRRLSHRLSGEGVLSVSAQDTRSRLRNQELAAARLEAVLLAALEMPKPRKRSRPPPSAGRNRLAAKRRLGLLKDLRRPPSGDA